MLLILSACGGDKEHFRMEGSLNGLNQGEFYVYSPDGNSHRLDTIQVRNGAFKYQVPLDTTTTYVIVFPNFSELPVIGTAGTVVKIEGDASHLKEIAVKGTKENERLTAFRLKTATMTPPEAEKEAAAFIAKNPKSPACYYLLNKYFIQTQNKNYQQAYALTDSILKANPGNLRMASLRKQLDGLRNVKENGRLPKFTVTDTKGKTVSNGDLYAKVNIITTWSTWNYESQNIQRQLKMMEKEHGSNKLKILSFCLDASRQACQKQMDRDSITWSNVCDGRMWETPALSALGLYKVPDNIITDSQGKIIALSLPLNKLKEKIETLMK